MVRVLPQTEGAGGEAAVGQVGVQALVNLSLRKTEKTAADVDYPGWADYN